MKEISNRIGRGFSSPSSTPPSMRSALEDLELDRLTVMYPGNRRYRLSEQVEVIPLAELAETIKKWS